MSKIDPAILKLGMRFRTLREKAGLSRLMVADLAECSERTVYRWENGETRPPKLVIKELERRIEKMSYADNNNHGKNGFTFIDLFAGIGGFRMGFQSIGGKCVYTSEWDKFARETYAANFNMDNNHPFDGDITQIPVDSIPSHDVLLAGFPCQPFSIAGVSKKNALGKPHGFEDETQGYIIFQHKGNLTLSQTRSISLGKCQKSGKP